MGEDASLPKSQPNVVTDDIKAAPVVGFCFIRTARFITGLITWSVIAQQRPLSPHPLNYTDLRQEVRSR